MTLKLVVGGAEGLITVAEAAKRYGVSTTWIHDRVRSGRIEADKSRHPMLVRVDGVKGMEGTMSRRPPQAQPYHTKERRSDGAKLGWQTRRRKAEEAKIVPISFGELLRVGFDWPRF